MVCTLAAYRWTKISGPSAYNIANANAAQTQVTGLVEGTYRFELKVTDTGGLYARDIVEINVLAAPVNNDPLRILSGAATLTHIGTLSDAKYVACHSRG